MITEIIDFLAGPEPQWYAILLVIVQFIRRFFRMPA